LDYEPTPAGGEVMANLPGRTPDDDQPRLDHDEPKPETTN
jgi:hypothetical protein